MTTTDRNYLQAQIEATLAEIDTMLSEAKAVVAESSDLISGVLHDESDTAKCEIDLKTVVRVHEHNIAKQAAFKAALSKMHTGTFGVCFSCGDFIGTQRLKAVPGATQCFECQGGTEVIARRGLKVVRNIPELAA